MSDSLSQLINATGQTIYMVFISSFLSILFGMIIGVCLFMTGTKQSCENTFVNRGLGFIVNVTRSTPFIILMISVIPLTRLLIGTTIGTNAAIVPLTLAAIPFFARVCESALQEVSPGLIEAAHAMGASKWQIVSKVLLPESLPALVRGATLTIIGLIGYSAMAGVVGGGGLGELAINYGYQRFDVTVMLETVIILIVLVQLIQIFGDFIASRRQIKSVFSFSIAMLLACMVYQVWPSAANANSLRIGIMSGAPEKIMQVAQQVAEKNYHLNLRIVTFSDYVQPNTALSNDSIDANIFQHVPYLQTQVAAHHYKLAVIAKTFVYPMGFYSHKITQLSQLPDNAVIAIPNDPSNEARSLLLLQKAGLISLKQGIATLATVNDIVSNPQNLQFKLLDAAQLPRVLNDADLVAITNDFLTPTGMTIKQAIIKEGSDSPYANIIVVRANDKSNPVWNKFIAVMHSPSVVKATEQEFPNGAAIPAWN